MLSTVKEVVSYRQMIVGLVRRDLRGRYKGSFLGFLWTFVNPLLQLVVYTLVFGVLFKSGIKNFYLYNFVGLIPWIFFSTCLTGGPGAVLDQAGLVTKVYFPREILPISYVTSQFMNMVYCFVIVLLVVFFNTFLTTPFSGYQAFNDAGEIINMGFHGPLNAYGDVFHFLPLLSLPILFIIEYLLCLGMTLFTSAVTVYVRDVRHILNVIGMLWMFCTPIMWSMREMFDPIIHPGRMEKWGWLFKYVNPMTGLIEGYHSVLYYGEWPDFSMLLAPLGWAIIILIIGYLVFEKAKKRFAEEM